MFVVLLVLALIYPGYKLLISNFSVTNNFLRFFRFYNWLKRYLVNPIRKKLIKDKMRIINVYKNGLLFSLENFKNNKFNDDDIIELYWKYQKHRYRTIFKGDSVDMDIYKTLNLSKAPRMNILMASLSVYNSVADDYDVFDISQQINEYAGPKGDFFKSTPNILNNQKYFIFKDRCRLMFQDKRDFIEYMDNMGDTVIISNSDNI